MCDRYLGLDLDDDETTGDAGKCKQTEACMERELCIAKNSTIKHPKPSTQKRKKTAQHAHDTMSRKRISHGAEPPELLVASTIPTAMNDSGTLIPWDADSSDATPDSEDTPHDTRKCMQSTLPQRLLNAGRPRPSPPVRRIQHNFRFGFMYNLQFQALKDGPFQHDISALLVSLCKHSLPDVAEGNVCAIELAHQPEHFQINQGLRVCETIIVLRDPEANSALHKFLLNVQDELVRVKQIEGMVKIAAALVVRGDNA